MATEQPQFICESNICSAPARWLLSSQHWIGHEGKQTKVCSEHLGQEAELLCTDDDLMILEPI